jgi:hypothetical protein
MEPIEVSVRSIRRAIANPVEVTAVSDLARAERSYWRALGSRGRVVGSERFADFVTVPVDNLVKYRCCVAHWRDGVPWEKTGVFDHMLRKIERNAAPESGCATLDDLRLRYARLDAVFAQVEREGRLRHAHELDAPTRVGVVWNGIEIHLGPGAEPIFGDAGTHRLAMARILGLRRIPALLGFVHETAMQHLPDLRRSLTSLVSAVSPWSVLFGAV